VRAVDCRSALCRIELTVASEEDGRHLEELAARTDHTRETFVTQGQDGLALVTYLSRDPPRQPSLP
jgi:hypothetical protein